MAKPMIAITAVIMRKAPLSNLVSRLRDRRISRNAASPLGRDGPSSSTVVRTLPSGLIFDARLFTTCRRSRSCAACHHTSTPDSYTTRNNTNRTDQLSILLLLSPDPPQSETEFPEERAPPFSGPRRI